MNINKIQSCLTSEERRYAYEQWSSGNRGYNSIAMHLSNSDNKVDIEKYRSRVRRFLKNVEEHEHRGEAMNEYADLTGVNPENISTMWHKYELNDGSKVSVKINNPYGKDDVNSFLQDTIEEMKEYAPEYKTIKRQDNKDTHMLVVNAFDIHIGKLCSLVHSNDEYNVEIATKRILEGVDNIINKVSGFNIDKIVFAGGNDILHTDHNKNNTTKGTQQDTDGTWYTNFIHARDLYVKIIERFIQLADVHYLHVPSNHDYVNGVVLSEVIKAWFSKNDNITFDVGPMPRKYIQYGASLIGFCHGDKIKENMLHTVMTTEAKQARAKSRFGYRYLGHIHHKVSRSYGMDGVKNIEKDVMSMNVYNAGYNLQPSDKVHVEYMRSASGTDIWHNESGYCHNPIAIEAFIHHPHYGQTDRIVNLY